MSNKLIFGGIFAWVLLGLYVFLAANAISVVNCTPQPDCLVRFTKPMTTALATIDGLVSALVITELALTPPDKAPAARSLNVDPRTTENIFVKIVTIAYLVVWTVIGLVTFIEGLTHPDILQALTDLGQGWLGLALASAYAYLGIKPKQ